MNLSKKPMAPAGQAPSSPALAPAPDPVRSYVLEAFGCGDAEAGLDLLLSIARRVNYARRVHPFFGGVNAVMDESRELVHECGDPSRAMRMRYEAIDLITTCIRLVNGEDE